MLRSLPAVMIATTVSFFATHLVAQDATQPLMKPAPGAKMVPNEYGGTFPSEIVWEKDGSVMVLVPGGVFKRGLSAEHGGAPGEGPEMEVNLPSFYIDKFEVSNKQYSIFVSDTAKARPRITNSNLAGDDKPVTAIDWMAASDYSQWVGKVLPTEAMWEKAARGGNNQLYTTGNEPPAKDVVIWGRGSIGETVPVTRNTGDVNGYGIYHMGGNVSEWVNDWYLRESYTQEGPDNPKGPDSGEAKVFRGGSYVTQKAEDTRVSRRMSQGYRQVLDELGIRTVWVPTDPSKITPTPTPVAATPTLPPQPTREELTEVFRKKLLVYLKDQAERLPQDMMASKAYSGGGNDEFQIVNFSPYELSLTFYGPDEDLCFKYNEPVPPVTIKNILLPKERNLTVLAYAPKAERVGPIVVGKVRAESKIIMVLKTEFFSPLTDEKGGTIGLLENTEAPQYYEGNFSPRWNELEVQNTLPTKMIVKIDDVTKGAKSAVRVSEHTLDSGQIMRLALPQGTFSFSADYIAAVEASSTPVEFKLDEKLARHLLVLQEDTARQGPGVTVVTEKKPYVTFKNLEAKRAAFTMKDGSKEKDSKKK
ncbi:SUMF1/EgtB/PvdO family nonheme iron enzyme [Candidatus Sumerlaeota bacterium]|nr:SUMF1/EgtB/PvdO family nonheme iron enzyme [Candidatus Sumerlaeota bacterium]